MLAALLALSLSATADPGKEKDLSADARKELTKLEGRWAVVKEVSSDGEKQLTSQAFTATFKGRTVVVNTVAKFEFTVSELDPATDPRLMDWTSLTDAGPVKKGMTFEAIYKLDGDTLTIAFYQGGGKQRPANFDPPKEAGTSVIVLTRVKE